MVGSNATRLGSREDPAAPIAVSPSMKAESLIDELNAMGVPANTAVVPAPAKVEVDKVPPSTKAWAAQVVKNNGAGGPLPSGPVGQVAEPADASARGHIETLKAQADGAPVVGAAEGVMSAGGVLTSGVVAVGAGGLVGQPLPAPAVMTVGVSATGAQFVPFGRNLPLAKGRPYFVMTGRQECKVCRHILSESERTGPNFGGHCMRLSPQEQAMCQAQMKALQACPEYLQNWCYKDDGGSQTLLSPCPEYLTCHYCLGMNPLHCLVNNPSTNVPTVYRSVRASAPY